MTGFQTATKLLTTLLILQGAHASDKGTWSWLWGSSNRSLQQTNLCITGNFVLDLNSKECNLTNIQEAYAKLFDDVSIHRVGCSNTIEQDLVLLLGGSDLEAAAAEICKKAQESQASMSFAQIAPDHTMGFVEEFYNGRTDWNEHRQTDQAPPSDGTSPAYVLKDEATNVLNYYDLVQYGKLELPDVPSLQNCAVNAAMCCYVADRQAGDNNGNCNTYDTDCDPESNPGDNTDICMVDLGKTSKSTGFTSSTGISIYENESNDGESAVHCHGFAWADDDASPTARYKGNNLFYVSMYDHMYKRGYVRNVPGAPMCGCLEQMPVVRRSDCTQVDVIESYRITYDETSGEVDAEVTRTEIDFNACQGVERNNDLLDYMKRLAQEGALSEDKVSVVNEQNIIESSNNCYFRVIDALLERGFMYSFEIDTEGWTYVAGTGTLANGPQLHDSILFKDMVEQSPNKIVRRVCPSCKATHKDIYYKRLTPIPNDLNLWDTFKNKWLETDNAIGVDFNLYSSYDDAINDKNKWQYCNYDYVGFPRDCGPTGYVGSQWNRFYSDTQVYAEDVAFYVEANPYFEPTKFNVAIGKLAYQSSTGWRGRADKAVDGYFQGYWWPEQSITHTREEAQPYWEVMLMNDDVVVNGVALFNRVDYKPERMTDVTVELLDAPVSGNVLASQSQGGAVGNMAYFTFNQVSGVQAVRVKLAGEVAYLSLAEVYVDGFESGSTLYNIAKGKPASMDTTYSDFEAGRAVDGITSGDWGDYSLAHTNWSQSPYWQVNLEGTYNILKVMVFNRSDCCRDRAKNLKIEILDEIGGNVLSEMSLTDDAYPDPVTAFDFNNILGGAVRLTADTNTINIAEVVVISDDSSDSGDSPVLSPIALPSVTPSTAPSAVPVQGATEEPTATPTVQEIKSDNPSVSLAIAASNTPTGSDISISLTSTPSSSPSDAPSNARRQARETMNGEEPVMSPADRKISYATISKERMTTRHVPATIQVVSPADRKGHF